MVKFKIIKRFLVKMIITKEKIIYNEIDLWIGFGTGETIDGKDNYKIII